MLVGGGAGRFSSQGDIWPFPLQCFQTGCLSLFFYSVFWCISVCFLNSGVWNAGIILFMYLFCSILTKRLL